MKVPQGLLDLDDRARAIRCNQQSLSPKSKGYAELMLIGDVHLGHAQCDEERFRSQLDYCLANDVYVLLMGDLIENSNRYSVGSGVYEQLENTQSQHERMVEALRPLAEKGLIIGSYEGNHEARTFKISGVNVAKALCRELNIPFLGGACWNRIRVGNQSYLLYGLHGASGSRFVYTKLKALVDISHNFDCDILVMGHVHECADTSLLVQKYDSRAKTIVEHKKFLIITGHYLRYDGSYGQEKGWPMGKLGSPKVKLFSGRRDIHISW
jgi:UDP-2,3-diacylglucosamine pyrophosphatase LpxH